MAQLYPASWRATRIARDRLIAPIVALLVCLPWPMAAQGLTGTLVVTVVDEHGSALAGAKVAVGSPNLVGEPRTGLTDGRGEQRFPALPPGQYEVNVSLKGFEPLRQPGIDVRAGDYLERTARLSVDPTKSVMVQASDSRDTRNGGLVITFGRLQLDEIPWQRPNPFEAVKAMPGISPASSTSTFFSSLGSPIDQNKFLFDGLDLGAPSNAVARFEPGIGSIESVTVQTIGATAEYGGMQGAVVNLISRSGGEQLIFAAAYGMQTAALTSQPQQLQSADGTLTGYERAGYRDFTTSLGGPLETQLRYFISYQHLRDYDSQPGANPAWPRKYKQDKVFGKLTWMMAPDWRLESSFHSDNWTNPERSTLTKPIEATQLVKASLPAINFGHLTHASRSMVWEVTVGHFRFFQTISPGRGDETTANRIDRPGEVWSGGPQQVGKLTHIRTNAKATVAGSIQELLGARHDWKLGLEFDMGEHRSLLVIPTLERFVYVNGVLSERTTQEPANASGRFVAAATFATDSIRMGDRVTLNVGVRFDHASALSPGIPELDQNGVETGDTIPGRPGHPPAWNVVSPRLGMTVKVDDAGRTIIRGSYGLFSQQMLTGEISPFHPGQTPMEVFNAAGTLQRTVNPSQSRPGPDVRAPYSHQFSVAVDRQIRKSWLASVAYVRKTGHDFIGWADTGGTYVEEPRTSTTGRPVVVDVLKSGPASRVFELANRDNFSLTYNGVVMALEKRLSRGWHAFTSYTWSRAEGLQPSSGSAPASAHVGTVGAPPVLFTSPVQFGRDPNDLRNAYGRLPSDRPHMFRAMASGDVPRTGLIVAANFQYLTGKPWAATTLVDLGAQNRQLRLLLEPPGSRRLPSQTLLDFRVSRSFRAGAQNRIDIVLDIFNALDDSAMESIITDNIDDAKFEQGNVFLDPRRAMLSVRLNLGGGR